jgi:hypothetical protein
LVSFKYHLSIPPMAQPSAKIPLPFTKISDWLFNMYIYKFSLSLSLDTNNNNNIMLNWWQLTIINNNYAHIVNNY